MARPDTAVIIGTRCRTKTALVGSLTNRPSGVRLPSASPVRKRRDGVADAQPARAGGAERPGPGADQQAQAREQDDDEAPADALHAGDDRRQAGLPQRVGEQRRAEHGRGDAPGRDPPALRSPAGARRGRPVTTAIVSRAGAASTRFRRRAAHAR